MTNDEMENCTFEPEAGTLNTYQHLLKRIPGMSQKEELFAEPNLQEYVDHFGTNLKKAHPEVYKAGVLKRAILLFN